MAPLEALYGRRCRSPIGWFEVGEAAVTGPDAVFEAMEKVRILSRVGKVAYEVNLPAELSSVHPVFHVSMLRRCIGNSVVIEPSKDLDIQNNLSFEEFPVEILDFQVKKLRSKEVPLVKVFWRNQSIEGATWEVEAEMRTKYTHLFSTNPERVE
ncbi:uncharacterized protein LOC124893580, partial [Capsicum annuum]|uniref:uncharacterized protein LOC124893580 n=1 Tax=Capsicum annuum TaxID=4072 RepID=UPI001FB0DEC2